MDDGDENNGGTGEAMVEPQAALLSRSAPSHLAVQASPRRTRSRSKQETSFGNPLQTLSQSGPSAVIDSLKDGTSYASKRINKSSLPPTRTRPGHRTSTPTTHNLKRSSRRQRSDSDEYQPEEALSSPPPMSISPRSASSVSSIPVKRAQRKTARFASPTVTKNVRKPVKQAVVASSTSKSTSSEC